MAGSTTRGGHSLARWGSLALLALAGCGGSGGGGSALEAAAVSAPCVTAFAPVQTSMLSTIGLSSKTEVAVAVPLSQCTLDASRNVTIGGGGCGPNVLIDQSFTGSSALGKHHDRDRRQAGGAERLRLSSKSRPPASAWPA